MSVEGLAVLELDELGRKRRAHRDIAAKAYQLLASQSKSAVC